MTPKPKLNDNNNINEDDDDDEVATQVSETTTIATNEDVVDPIIITHDEERVSLTATISDNNNHENGTNKKNEETPSSSSCFSRIPNTVQCVGVIALYLSLWVLNSTLLQGIASGSLSHKFEAYNKPFFLTYLDHNFHMLSFVPVYFYVRFQRGYSMKYYLTDVWAERFGFKRAVIVCIGILYILTFQNVFLIMGLECVNIPTSNAVYQLQAGFTILLSVFVFGDAFVCAEAIGLLVSFGGILLIVLPPILAGNKLREEPDEITDPRIQSCHNPASSSALVYGVTATALSAVLWSVFQVGWRWQFEARHKSSRHYMTKTEGIVDTLTTLAFVGLTNLFVGWPFVLIFHFTGAETFELPFPSQWALIILNGVVECLFDFSCALAIYITSPVITAITAPLVIPLGFFTDYLIYRTDSEAAYVWWYLSGAFFVLAGTLIVEMKPDLFSCCCCCFSRSREEDVKKSAEIEPMLETKLVP